MSLPTNLDCCTLQILTHLSFSSLLYRSPRGLSPKVVHNSLNGNQEEGRPARIFNVALVEVSPLSPEPG